MATCRPDDTTRQLRGLFDLGVVATLSDAQLLDRFAEGGTRAESAFSALVERHGPMVLRVCRTHLSDPHDVDDAFQATFLVLVRKADAIRRRTSLASWLHGVALRVAAGIRSDAARRTRHERQAAELAEDDQDESAGVPPRELRQVLDEELGRLREAYRSPLVLHYLEGRSCEEVARQLGWPLGTVKSRLARGRERLRGRLVRRGVAPAVGLLALPDPSEAAVPPSLVARAFEAATAAGIVGRAAAVATRVGSALRGGGVARAATVAGVMLATIGLAAGYVSATRGQGQKAGQATAPAKKADPIHLRVVDREGRPVAGARIYVPGTSAPFVTARSDAEGRASIARAAAGESPAFVCRHGDALAWAQFYPYPGTSGGLKVNLGTADDPVLLKLFPVSHKVAGRVVDQQGRPVRGAKVLVLALSLPDALGVIFRRLSPEEVDSPFGGLVTDENGTFTLTIPEGSRVTLEAAHPRLVGPWFGPSDPAQDTISPVTLQPSGSVVVTLVDAATGQPVVGATVSARLLERRDEILGSGYGESRSDAQGRCTLKGFGPGVYNVHLRKVPGRERATARAAGAIRVTAGQDTRVELRVIEGRPLRGVVVDAATEQPVAGVKVVCQGPANPRTGAAAASIDTDELGRFVFYVPPGEQYVYIEWRDFNNRLGKANPVVPEAGEVPLVRLVWTNPTCTQAYANAGMQKASTAKAEAAAPAKKETPARPELRTVSGHVRRAKGAPAVGVAVSVVGFGDPVRPGEPRPEYVSAVIDREGLYVLRDVPRRALRVLLHDPVRDGTHGQGTIPADVETADLVYAPGPLPPSYAPSDEPVPDGLKDRLTFVDLAPRATEALADGPGGGGNDLARLPRGVRRLGGTFFRVGDRMIRLGGWLDPTLPTGVEGLPVGAKAKRLHLLHAAQLGGDVTSGKEIGAYVVHFDDGSVERIPVLYGRNIANWWRFPKGGADLPSEARVAWEGTNESTDLNPGLRLRLFAMTWTNPHPGRTITRVDATSTDPAADLFLVGLTLERD